MQINYNKISPHPIRMIIMKKTDNTKCDRVVEQLECSYTSSMTINLHNPTVNVLLDLSMHTFYDPAILLQETAKKHVCIHHQNIYRIVMQRYL